MLHTLGSRSVRRTRFWGEFFLGSLLDDPNFRLPWAWQLMFSQDYRPRQSQESTLQTMRQLASPKRPRAERLRRIGRTGRLLLALGRCG